MATPKKKKTSEEQLAAVETEVLSAEQSAPQEETPLGGAPPSEVELPQTESDNEIQSAGSEDNADSKNESGEIPAITDAPPSQTVRTRKRIILPDNDMNVLTIDNKLGVQTEADKARDAMLDLIESLRTRRYLTDTLEGVEKSTTGGEPRAVLYHGDFKVIIPASLVVKLPNDLRDQDPFEVYHYLLSSALALKSIMSSKASIRIPELLLETVWQQWQQSAGITMLILPAMAHIGLMRVWCAKPE